MASRNFALVTGASSGIGLELARVFAQNGYDLIVNANSERLETATAELQNLGVEVIPVVADQATYEGVEQLWRTVEDSGRVLHAAAINAGIGAYGDFARESSLEEELRLIDLNVKGTVHLAKRVLAKMTRYGQGKVLLTSSIAGSIPAPLEAVYGASKAFVLSLGEALRNELKDTKVTITVLQPGPTATDFFHRARMDHTKVGSEGKFENDPAEVAKQGFQALMDGKDHVFSESLKTKVEGVISKVVPTSTATQMHRKQVEPKQKEKESA
ncbi:MAG: SDR family NAD(P)-dependent oxidoreductase [Acidobacteria bacterium]|nr:SDR family NAD(P)-dependent oxidoreductase [Acidobacteriota bacterium]